MPDDSPQDLDDEACSDCSADWPECECEPSRPMTTVYLPGDAPAEATADV